MPRASRNSEGVEVALGVTGSIAAYKACELARLFVKDGLRVTVVMTRNAREFVTPLTFETITCQRVYSDMFAERDTYEIDHVAIAKRADIFVVAPASANIIGKMANGMADDLLSTLLLAAKQPVVVAPAMNSAMYLNPLVQKNLAALKALGVSVVEPGVGELACGDSGVGRMAEPEQIFSLAVSLLSARNDLAGTRCLVTAGPTWEPLDPVRHIGNPSSGRMGFALASAALRRGANVTLVSGPAELAPPAGAEFVSIKTAGQMRREVVKRGRKADIVIMAAAVSDYAPVKPAASKMKKGAENLTVELERTPDILGELGASKKPGQTLVGFSMETEDLVSNSRKKLKEKNLDFIVANNIGEPGAGFRVETNVATIIEPRTTKKLPLMSKPALADKILDRIVALRSAKSSKRRRR